jgi:DNA sulfur modification protein DndB
MELHPTDGHIVAGVVIDQHRFLGRMRASQLFQVAIDPRRTEDLRQLEGNTQLQTVREIRLEVQRLFEGAKAKNVEPYARYVVNVHDGQDGMAPPIILFSEKALPVVDDPAGPGRIQIPWDVQLVAIDGETQLAARFEAANIKSDTKNDFVPILVCHGRSIQWARQVFHDLNLLAVKPNAALGLSMDERDPLTQTARNVAANVPFFKGRVNFKRRQLGTKDKEVITFAALRGACVTLAKGIGGVAYGARPVPVPMKDVPNIERAAIEWFGALARVIGPAMENRSQTLASSSSIMAALGAMGHALVDVGDDAQRRDLCKELVEQLRAVRWEKGKAWEGIAGKFGLKGKFSTSGAKDAAYGVYSALTDDKSSGYQRVRGKNASGEEKEAKNSQQDSEEEAEELVAQTAGR